SEPASRRRGDEEPRQGARDRVDPRGRADRADGSRRGVVPPMEDDPTYRGNALIKARSLLSLSSGPCLADDSGIEVDALDGGPGPRSARYAGEGASDEENLHKLIEVVRRTPERARGARYRCVAVIVVPSGEEHVVEAIVEGTLITEPRGSGGFGYDPIFVPA